MSSNDPTRREFLATTLVALAPGGFARTMADLSGPETGPPADNLVSNEDSYPRVAGELARTAPPGSAYIGVGPDQNFTMIARSRPARAIVVDHRRRNALLHLIHKALFELADDRPAYLARMTARSPARPLPDDPTADDLVAAFAPAPIDRARLDANIAEVAARLVAIGAIDDADRGEVATIQARLAGPGLDARFLALRMYPTLAKIVATRDRDGRPAHFLADGPAYRVVRDLQRADRVVPAVGDLGDPATLGRVGDRLRRDGDAVGVVYVSDVEFFLLRAGRFGGYLGGLRALPWADGAVIVRTSTRPIDHPDRAPGDSSTTVVRPARRFLDDARAGRIATVADLFRG